MLGFDRLGLGQLDFLPHNSLFVNDWIMGNDR